MKVPIGLFLASIQEKKVFYFVSDQINSSEPHIYICLKRSANDVLIMACCTSQFETVRKFIEARKLPKETLVWISPRDPENPFSRDTYVNCNNCFTFTVAEFRQMYESDSISLSGEISEIHFEQILIGVHSSPLIEEETKDLLPKPND